MKFYDWTMTKNFNYNMLISQIDIKFYFKKFGYPNDFLYEIMH